MPMASKGLFSVVVIEYVCNNFQSEAIPESMKNMLLVMSTSGVFDHNEDDQSLQLTQKAHDHLQDQDSKRHYSALWQVTWERIDCFLPNLRREMVASRSPFSPRASSPPIHPEPEAQTMETEGRPLSDDESSTAPPKQTGKRSFISY